MSRRRVEAWAVVDVDGFFLAGPSSSRSEVEKESARRWGDHAFKATRFVPVNPRAAALIKAALRWDAINQGPEDVDAHLDAIDALEKAAAAYRRGSK